MAEKLDEDVLNTGDIRNWRSIVTLLVFIVTNIVVLAPFHLPIYVPRRLVESVVDALSALRIIPGRKPRFQHDPASDGEERDDDDDDQNGKAKRKPFVRWNFPMNFVTAPLIADLFLLAILAIGREEVRGGTLGANNISPLDIMAFFITLAYIAISIDASGLIRFLAFKVLQKGGKVGHRLFFYLYTFFFGLGSFIGNDPIVLSGTAFLAYMTRVSSNIIHPRAWIHTQFAVANIASAILVSSNPTNLVLAGAFEIKFIVYTAHMIVPVVATAIVLFPFLLYIIFADPALIPYSIEMHELSEEAKAKKPVNPNIPHARGLAEEDEANANDDQVKLLSLEEIMNPFLDKGGAAFGAVIMTATLVTLLALNAATQNNDHHPIFWVTLPAAFVMFCWDVAFGWYNRHETREIARKGRQEVENARIEHMLRAEEEMRLAALAQKERDSIDVYEVPLVLTQSPEPQPSHDGRRDAGGGGGVSISNTDDDITLEVDASKHVPIILTSEKGDQPTLVSTPPREPSPSSVRIPSDNQLQNGQGSTTSAITMMDDKQVVANTHVSQPSTQKQQQGEKLREEHIFSNRVSQDLTCQQDRGPATLVSLLKNAYRWTQDTFPTVTAVVAHLPFALVPFAFTMFVLVQALVTKGWVPVFAYGWDHWVNKTGTVGAIGGMGFLSVILCNFAGTNIGTTILLSRVIQAWQKIHEVNQTPISDRTFWATVYSMAIGVNYGAFSTAFSASLAGLLWRDILARKHIRVRSLDFARVNLPIIAIAMAVGLSVLIGEVYIVRDNTPYKPVV
ncbi:arsenite efflux transporter ArsB-like [Histoplasma capsulatum G186AR]|uniref:Arsenite efflux transporter ArsB-like n=1 Tax=Ajellomyces capsulatus TaxID=5037 RepID=A0A8H8D667_AJECA|nr:arsenite efflux transporter ArsB-like [Histoplasma capsulatum]QSS72137.1 arsenite efflux transporter ArsB-like [Histoplasma capsulatum G186AR]